MQDEDHLYILLVLNNYFYDLNLSFVDSIIKKDTLIHE